ncbi:MAG: hypothetical protein KBG28_08770 [Kofleriaceae bacterium]|nr:hypothetical protein [Kofleriaceae bacterium]
MADDAHAPDAAAPTSGRAAAARSAAPEPGAPVPAGTIDPELVRLRQKAPGVGMVAALSLVVLAGWMAVRLLPDLRFSRAGAEPMAIGTEGLLAGPADRFVELRPDLVGSQVVRLRGGKATEFRLIPVAGTGDRAWIVVDGSPWIEAPLNGGYAGRTRALDDTPMASALRGYVAGRTWPLFANLAAVRAAGAGPITTVSGDPVTVAPTDAIEVDLVLADAATIEVTFNTRLPDEATWRAALVGAGILDAAARPSEMQKGGARYGVQRPDAVADVTRRLEAAGLWAARASAVARVVPTTLGELLRGPLTVEGRVVPDAQVKLVRIAGRRVVPGDARLLIVGEKPADYWYALPLVIALGVIALLFTWALARAVRRELIVPRRAAA